MKFGLFGINNGHCAFPKTAAAVARAAEDAGFESVWTGEHVILPDPQAPPSPVAADFPMLDPTVALAFVAAHTSRLRLGTGIIILPQRNPIVLAKELASADVLSNGRLIFGIGIGYLKPEFDAIGAPFDHKGARAEEYLAAMIALWSMPKPEFKGRWVNFKGVNAMPRPAQKPHPEIVFGGHTAEAYSRAARLAKGWYGFALDVGSTAKCVEGLRAACQKVGRKFDDLEISVTPRGAVDLDTAKKFADLGVSRLILLQRGSDEASALAQVSDVGRTLIGKI
ncbi:MAG: LLM class F420-dependent oxidoreductase [Candidatus Binatus sp.]|uniref:LLM class F420-dependent oxidoreductase n=1 Tax=Candidatus Binatus sp. TaxID=2811406 RepID=UPI002719DC48|nr:LLM class F420-dependent oxidoreductase [Candidatus Binatus sp.]MDO8434566.1 LLM class F420-dependent oxidoreductase [Candidatus Binatus sp.]